MGGRGQMASVHGKNFGLYPKSESESLTSLKQRSDMSDEPLTVENGLGQIPDLTCTGISGGYLFKSNSPHCLH